VKLPSNILLAFVPWTAFWQQNFLSLHDQSSIRFGFSSTKACTQVEKISKGVVALNSATQEQGISSRTQPLGEGEAMLFINMKPKVVTFWMLKTIVPLDIAHYDSTGWLREVYHMPVEQDPVHPQVKYRSKIPIQVSIEMKPGIHDKLWSHPYLCVDLGKNSLAPVL
jgi:uncharacterized membrane protein (UPF0127 family)